METLAIWNRLASKPCGKWLFSRLVCLKAPYFTSIRPRFVALGPGHAEVRIDKRRAVLNHLRTVHAIARCNLAELAGGTMTDVSVPRSHRWIPKGMTVRYLHKANTALRAVTRQDSDFPEGDQSGECRVHVDVIDREATVVFTADIDMWVSPRKRSKKNPAG